jgi:hypothetical protein
VRERSSTGCSANALGRCSTGTASTSVWHGPSMDDPDSYTLMRSFGSAEARDREESAFYGSDEWRDGPREPILALIETYHTIVLPAPSSTIDGLRRIASSTGKAR